jgi:hypothetical protein
MRSLLDGARIYATGLDACLIDDVAWLTGC